MEYEDFVDESEAMDWIESKVLPFERADKPPKYHSNFKLMEWWFVYSSLTVKQRKAEVEENMTKSAGELGAGLSLIGIEENGKQGQKKMPSAPEKAKAAHDKIKKASNRLARLLSTSDSQLPSLKRRLSPDRFAKFKRGVAQCRDCRETVLDAIEDLKCVPDGEEAQGQYFEELCKMHQQLVEHADVLQESMASDAKKVKQESAMAAPTPPAGSADMASQAEDVA